MLVMVIFLSVLKNYNHMGVYQNVLISIQRYIWALPSNKNKEAVTWSVRRKTNISFTEKELHPGVFFYAFSESFQAFIQ